MESLPAHGGEKMPVRHNNGVVNIQITSYLQLTMIFTPLF